jgi:hypothetical protein
MEAFTSFTTSINSLSGNQDSTDFEFNDPEKKYITSLRKSTLIKRFCQKAFCKSHDLNKLITAQLNDASHKISSFKF